MPLTFAEVRKYYKDEMMEIALATQEQIDQLCIETGDDRPQMAYDQAVDDLAYMVSDAVGEFMR